MKRYIRIDLEYDSDNVFSWATMDNIKRLLKEDMPYLQVLFMRDSPSREGLNEGHHTVEKMK